MTEAGIDEMEDDLEVRINFAVTRDNQNIFSGFHGLQGVFSRPPLTYWGRFSQSDTQWSEVNKWI